MSFLIMYSLFFFNSSKNQKIEWFNLIGQGVFVDVYSLIRNTIFLFLFFGFFSMNHLFIWTNVYVFLTMIITHYFSTCIYYVFISMFNKYKGKYVQVSEDVSTNEEFKNLDKFDEEIILGINCA